MKVVSALCNANISNVKKTVFAVSKFPTVLPLQFKYKIGSSNASEYLFCTLWWSDCKIYHALSLEWQQNTFQSTVFQCDPFPNFRYLQCAMRTLFVIVTLLLPSSTANKGPRRSTLGRFTWKSCFRFLLDIYLSQVHLVSFWCSGALAHNVPPIMSFFCKWPLSKET